MRMKNQFGNILMRKFELFLIYGDFPQRLCTFTIWLGKFCYRKLSKHCIWNANPRHRTFSFNFLFLFQYIVFGNKFYSDVHVCLKFQNYKKNSARFWLLLF